MSHDPTTPDVAYTELNVSLDCLDEPSEGERLLSGEIIFNSYGTKNKRNYFYVTFCFCQFGVLTFVYKRIQCLL